MGKQQQRRWWRLRRCDGCNVSRSKIVRNWSDGTKKILTILSSFLLRFAFFVSCYSVSFINNSNDNSTASHQWQWSLRWYYGEFDVLSKWRSSSIRYVLSNFFNAVPFKDADTAARSFERPIKNAGSIRSVLRPLDTDASRSFHTLGAAVPPFGAGEPLYVRSNRRSIHPNRLLLPGNHLL